MNKEIIRLSAYLIVLFSVLSLILGIVNYSFYEIKIVHQIASYGYISVFLLIIFIELLPQYVNPHIIILSVFLLGFNPLVFVLVAMAASLIGSLAGFYIGRKYGLELARDFIGNKRLSWFSKKINKFGGKLFIFLSTFTPLPYFPIVFGSLGMKRKTFIYYGLIPRIASFLILVYILDLLL